MSEQDQAVDRATRKFGTDYALDTNTIDVGSVTRERIPNPPLDPGQMSIGLVRYRYIVQLRSGNLARHYRVEGKHVYEG